MSANQPETFLVTWGFQNARRTRCEDFSTALELAKALLMCTTHERPTIRCTDRDDYDSDGLTEEQRAACEALDLEVDRP